MGSSIVDRYTIFHFGSGIIAYYLKIPLLIWLLLNIAFEITENSSDARGFIQSLKYWPGGKEKSDSLINSISDIIFASIGWLLPYYYYL
jgi:hypothetical protein